MMQQDLGYITSERLWVTKAKDNTYIQAIIGRPMQNILVVNITEKRAPKNNK
jgi:hypothetical protein